MNTLPPHSDTPIEISGYITDPKRVGFQIVTNYEGTYWRRLVGTDAWSLYEVLRSFCHEGSNACHPSINLLMDILGFPERRMLTGRTTKVKGVPYHYPGFIEQLQRFELLTAEVQGEGPYMRYVFHVNMTPGLLTDEQVAQLPKLLQEKHANLLMRCEEAIRLLKAKRRPSKVPVTDDEIDKRGSGNLPEGGLAKTDQGSGNLPDKQQQNNTHENNNSSGGADAPPGVIALLRKKGIAEKVSLRLASRYSKQRIEHKIDYLETLQERNPRAVSDPPGWLRKAIEEDYAPPAGYKPKAQRQAEAAARERRRQATEQTIEAQEQESRSGQPWHEWLSQSHRLPDELVTLTNQLRQVLRERLPDITYNTWARQLMLIELSRDRATLAVPSQAARAALLDYKTVLDEALIGLLGHSVETVLEVIKQPLERRAERRGILKS